MPIFPHLFYTWMSFNSGCNINRRKEGSICSECRTRITWRKYFSVIRRLPRIFFGIPRIFTKCLLVDDVVVSLYEEWKKSNSHRDFTRLCLRLPLLPPFFWLKRPCHDPFPCASIIVSRVFLSSLDAVRSRPSVWQLNGNGLLPHQSSSIRRVCKN